jgi:hypothetical protein
MKIDCSHMPFEPYKFADATGVSPQLPRFPGLLEDRFLTPNQGLALHGGLPLALPQRTVLDTRA